MPSSDTTRVHVEVLRPGLAVARLPLPFRVEPVNCYVLGDPASGLAVVDTGYAMGAEPAWRAALAQLGAGLDDVAHIVVTHFHPDHIGASGPLARLTGAEVLVSEVTARQAPLVWAEAHRLGAFERIYAQLLQHGFPPAHVEQLGHEVQAAGLGVDLADRFGRLPAEGGAVTLGGEPWEVVLTPGHADGHVSLFQRERRELLAGDHLLERISPAVGLFPDHHPDPLGLYIDSLERIAALAPETVWPGHGQPFTDAAGRCDSLRVHHERRVAACLAALVDGPATAWDVAQVVFGIAHDVANQRFALTETLAHLEFARIRGSAHEGVSGARLDPDRGSRLRLYSVAPPAGVG